MTQKLIDLSSTLHNRPWAVHMRNNRKIADLYYQLYNKTRFELYLSKYMRLKSCANIIKFNEIDVLTKKIVFVRFCRVRLCPICQWRRSLYVFQQFLRVSSYAISHLSNLRFIFVTFTCKNITLSFLRSAIDHLFASWSRLTYFKEYKKSVLGAFKTFEITHNNLDDTYHPHFHVIFAVNSSYFHNSQNTYINHSKWVALWKKALKVSYDPLVNVRVVKNRRSDISDFFVNRGTHPLARAAAELSKYSVKINDCIIDNNDAFDALDVFDSVLHKRRFITYTGYLKKCYQALNEVDSDKADLLHIEDSSGDDVYIEKTYQWDEKLQNYFLTS